MARFLSIIISILTYFLKGNKMDTVFKQETIDSLTKRIDLLTESSSARWGKHSVYQMIKHCILSEKMYLCKTEYKQLFVGKLFGKMALKGMLKDDSPLGKNKPTHPSFKITDSGNVKDEKKIWIELVKEYTKQDSSKFSNFCHPFFGKMTKDQLGIAAYKHIDHHLRQFSV